MGGKKTVEKGREYEKCRRNKINDRFDQLRKVLPDQDPSIVLSKSEILTKAAEYIKHLQEQNEDILKNGKETFLDIETDRLRKRVAHLVWKTKLLVDALREAGIPIPTGTEKKKKKKNKKEAIVLTQPSSDKPDVINSHQDLKALQRIASLDGMNVVNKKKEPLKEVNATLSSVKVPEAVPTTAAPQSTSLVSPMCGSAASPQISVSSVISLNAPNSITTSPCEVAPIANTVPDISLLVNTRPAAVTVPSNLNIAATTTPTNGVPLLVGQSTLTNLAPGTFILTDGRFVVPPAQQQIFVKPPQTLILVPKSVRSEKIIYPKKRDVTKTTFANKRPIPSIKRFKLEMEVKKLLPNQKSKLPSKDKNPKKKDNVRRALKSKVATVLPQTTSSKQEPKAVASVKPLQKESPVENAESGNADASGNVEHLINSSLDNIAPSASSETASQAIDTITSKSVETVSQGIDLGNTITDNFIVCIDKDPTPIIENARDKSGIDSRLDQQLEPNGERMDGTVPTEGSIISPLNETIHISDENKIDITSAPNSSIPDGTSKEVCHPSREGMANPENVNLSGQSSSSAEQPLATVECCEARSQANSLAVKDSPVPEIIPRVNNYQNTFEQLAPNTTTPVSSLDGCVRSNYSCELATGLCEPVLSSVFFPQNTDGPKNLEKSNAATTHHLNSENNSKASTNTSMGPTGNQSISYAPNSQTGPSYSSYCEFIVPSQAQAITSGTSQNLEKCNQNGQFNQTFFSRQPLTNQSISSAEPSFDTYLKPSSLDLGQQSLKSPVNPNCTSKNGQFTNSCGIKAVSASDNGNKAVDSHNAKFDSNNIQNQSSINNQSRSHLMTKPGPVMEKTNISNQFNKNSVNSLTHQNTIVNSCVNKPNSLSSNNEKSSQNLLTPPQPSSELQRSSMNINEKPTKEIQFETNAQKNNTHLRNKNRVPYESSFQISQGSQCSYSSHNDQSRNSKNLSGTHNFEAGAVYQIQVANASVTGPNRMVNMAVSTPSNRANIPTSASVSTRYEQSEGGNNPRNPSQVTPNHHMKGSQLSVQCSSANFESSSALQKNTTPNIPPNISLPVASNCLPSIQFCKQLDSVKKQTSNQFHKSCPGNQSVQFDKCPDKSLQVSKQFDSQHNHCQPFPRCLENNQPNHQFENRFEGNQSAQPFDKCTPNQMTQQFDVVKSNQVNKSLGGQVRNQPYNGNHNTQQYDQRMDNHPPPQQFDKCRSSQFDSLKGSQGDQHRGGQQVNQQYSNQHLDGNRMINQFDKNFDPVNRQMDVNINSQQSSVPCDRLKTQPQFESPSSVANQHFNKQMDIQINRQQLEKQPIVQCEIPGESQTTPQQFNKLHHGSQSQELKLDKNAPQQGGNKQFDLRLDGNNQKQFVKRQEGPSNSFSTCMERPVSQVVDRRLDGHQNKQFDKRLIKVHSNQSAVPYDQSMMPRNNRFEHNAQTLPSVQVFDKSQQSPANKSNHRSQFDNASPSNTQNVAKNHPPLYDKNPDPQISNRSHSGTRFSSSSCLIENEFDKPVAGHQPNAQTNQNISNYPQTLGNYTVEHSRANQVCNAPNNPNAVFENRQSNQQVVNQPTNQQKFPSSQFDKPGPAIPKASSDQQPIKEHTPNSAQSFSCKVNSSSQTNAAGSFEKTNLVRGEHDLKSFEKSNSESQFNKNLPAVNQYNQSQSGTQNVQLNSKTFQNNSAESAVTPTSNHVATPNPQGSFDKGSPMVQPGSDHFEKEKNSSQKDDSYKSGMSRNYSIDSLFKNSEGGVPVTLSCVEKDSSHCQNNFDKTGIFNQAPSSQSGMNQVTAITESHHTFQGDNFPKDCSSLSLDHALRDLGMASGSCSVDLNKTPCSKDPIKNFSDGNTSLNDLMKSKELERNAFMPLLDDVRLGTDFPGDLFSSFQLPPGGQHAESMSPTAAFLLAFPLVSTSKTAETLGESDNPENNASTPTTILQIGGMDPPSTELFPNQVDSLRKPDENPKDYERFGNYEPIYDSTLQSNEQLKRKTPPFVENPEKNFKRCDTRKKTNASDPLLSFSQGQYSYPIFSSEFVQSAQNPDPKTSDMNMAPWTSMNQSLPQESAQNSQARNNKDNTAPGKSKVADRKKGKQAKPCSFNQSSTQTEFFNTKVDGSKKQKIMTSKTPVNWMTPSEPQVEIYSQNKESEPTQSAQPPQNTYTPLQNLDVPFDNISFPTDFNSKKPNNYSWSPSKSLLPSFDAHSFVIPSTLPTLVGDLALGTSTPSESFKSYDDKQKTDTKKSSTAEKKRSPEFNKQSSGSNFLSVSQLVDPKNQKQKMDMKVSKRVEKQDKFTNAVPCNYRNQGDLNCMYSKNSTFSSWNQNEKQKNQYKGGSYSAESLIANPEPEPLQFNSYQGNNYFSGEFPIDSQNQQQYQNYLNSQPHFPSFLGDEFTAEGFPAQRSKKKQKEIYQQQQGTFHQTYQGCLKPCTPYMSQQTTSTLTNFNLTTIFPEMNDQRVQPSSSHPNSNFTSTSVHNYPIH